MSGATLIAFLGDDPGWMRIVGDRVVMRRSGLDTLPVPDSDGDEEERLVLVVPGADVRAHWSDIPASLTAAQAGAAARIAAESLSAEPLETQHHVIGEAHDDARCILLAAREKMDAWLAEATRWGFDPDIVIPAPFLIAPPEEGVRIFAVGDEANVRGQYECFSAEENLVPTLIGDIGSEIISAEAFERGIATALASVPANLRNGDYAKRRRWKIHAGYGRRLAILAASLLLATLLIQLTMIAKYSFGAEALEREAMERARDAIPGNVEITEPEAQLRARLAELGGGPGYGEIASAAFSAIRDTAGVELQAMIYSADGDLQLTAAAPGEAEHTALQQRMIAEGLRVSAGAVRDGGGRQIAEYRVSAP